ncbi:hypothetical protein FN846DRAFT_886414 [Sphaerosporella brunnea]|uniref:Uncharacterized protein n=1 Tax=Sphaerosporella brunnea TaxID=1250544 RepID=A0A5J5F9X5_9PEZI|nr:hypothetical protein FN846DRAFT_886414 [Sphaerosporella brunnea]
MLATMRKLGSGFSFRIFVEIDQLRSGPQTNRTSCFADWAQKNQTLIVGFGGTGMIIANEWYGRRDVKDDMGQRHDGKLAELHTEHEITQGIVLNCAVKTMKAIDGNKTELREFVTNAEKVLRCVELGEDCQEGINKPRSADGKLMQIPYSSGTMRIAGAEVNLF